MTDNDSVLCSTLTYLLTYTLECLHWVGIATYKKALTDCLYKNDVITSSFTENNGIVCDSSDAAKVTS